LAKRRFSGEALQRGSLEEGRDRGDFVGWRGRPPRSS
jgi:hypothetical protein